VRSAAVERYSAPTFEKQEPAGFAVFALAGGVELAPGAQLVFVGLFAGKSRQHDVAGAARAKLAELGWKTENAAGARLVSAKPSGFRTTPELAEPEPEPEPPAEPEPEPEAPAKPKPRRRANGKARS
jgi:hypothetical protein